MMVTKKNVSALLKGMIAAMPAIPLFTKPRRTPILAYVLGGVGLAFVGGIAAVMWMSPRTRTRALSAAKDTYGKVNEMIGHQTQAGQGGIAQSNGISSDRNEFSTSTGL